MTDRERAEAMQDMHDTLDGLDERRRRSIIRTHTDILLSLPRKDREALTRTTGISEPNGPVGTGPSPRR